MPGVFLGTFLLVSLATATLRVVLGVVVLLAALWRWGIVARGAGLAAAAAGAVEIVELPSAPPSRGGTAAASSGGGGVDVRIATSGDGACGGTTASSDSASAAAGYVAGVGAAAGDAATALPPPSASVSVACIPITSAAYVCGAATAGVASGILSGMNGIGGPPIMVFVTVIRMARRTARSTQAIVSSFNTAFNVASLLLVAGPPRRELAPLVGATAAAALAGLGLGVWANGRLTEGANTVIILSILSLSSATLVTTDFAEACGALAAIGAFVGAVFCAHLIWGRRRRR